MHIKHIFFDLDRTLWDFDKNSEATLLDIYDKFELNERIFAPHQFVKKYKAVNAKYWHDYRNGKTTKALLRIGRFSDTLKHFGFEDLTVKNRIEIGEYYVKSCPKGKAMFPNTHEALAELKSLGFNMHIITNGFTESQTIKLAACDLNQYFDVIICSDAFGNNKPHRSIFEHALKEANAKREESIMIGDNFNVDVLGAERVGIRGVLFDPVNYFQPRKGVEKIGNLLDLKNLILFNSSI